MSKIGVYVGSFNPVHKGHIKVANYLIDNKIVDKVLLLATPNYWNKQDLLNINDRVNMLKFFETENIIVDDVHNNHEYTYEILAELKKDYPNDELYLVIGSDNLEKLHLWKNIDLVLQNKIIVLNRNNIKIEKYLERFNRDNFIIINDFDFIEISSTEIRNNLDNICLDNRVKNYIINNKLYELWR